MEKLKNECFLTIKLLRYINKPSGLEYPRAQQQRGLGRRRPSRGQGIGGGPDQEHGMIKLRHTISQRMINRCLRSAPSIARSSGMESWTQRIVLCFPGLKMAAHISLPFIRLVLSRNPDM
ncbi:hypothetical protein Ancab_038887 [Ancistrocladus abbreviatus]